MIRVVSLVSHLSPTSIPLEIATATADFPEIDVTVASFYDDSTSGEYNVPVVPLRANSRFDVAAFYRLWQLLLQDDVDVVHTHENFIGSVARVPGTLADVSIVDTEHRQHDSFTLLQNAVNAPTIALADRVVANSKATERSFQSFERVLLDSDQIAVVHNGVDIARVDSAITEGTGRDKADGIRIITVGRLIKVKNQKLLLRAFAEALKSFPVAELVMVGGGPLRNELEGCVDSLGIRKQVQFLGEIPREEVYSQLALSDLFALPSSSEGFCVAAVEAMAAGLPVVASDIDVLHEVVGEPGVFADPDDPTEFADALIALAEDPERRERLGTEAKERARSTFSLERTAREYYNIYKQLAEGAE
jgi:glycosyltransferase involved in cell wall biosynthesis